jgi:putative ABC transport system ATP-binding protein
MYVIETRDLKKIYGTGEALVEALRGVHLSVAKGEFAAIMGPSGSGKSTLLHMLGGVDTPSDGEILLEGTDLGSLDDDERTLMRRQRLGFIFQSFNLLPAFTAEENVSLPLDLSGIPSSEARRRAAEMLDLVGMSHRRTHVPSALSGGEQQRVAIARALVMRPALLLADEPTGNLDTKHSRQITGLMRRLVDDDGQTIVMVTHDEGVAAQADRIVRLRDGLIETEETVQRDEATSRDLGACLRVVKPGSWQSQVARHGSLRQPRLDGVLAALAEKRGGSEEAPASPSATAADVSKHGIGLGVLLARTDATVPPAMPRTCMFKRRS